MAGFSAPISQQSAKSPVAGGRSGRSILLLAPEIFSSEGGIPRILQLYLRALCEIAAPDDIIHLVALNDPSISEADVQRVTAGRLTSWWGCDRDKLRFIRTTLRIGRHCDHLICGHVAQLPAALAAKAINPRLTYDFVAHGVEVWRPLKWVDRLALRYARRALCVSDYTRNQLLARCSLPPARALVLPNATDPAFPVECAEPPDRPSSPTILVVARLTQNDRKKGVPEMIRALPAVREALPDVRLRIIGRGDALDELQSLAESLNLRDVVEFTGYLDDEKLRASLQECSLLALPSCKEGFGLVFIEAMACGRPCLGANAGGIPEVITEDTGVIVEYGDVAGIARGCIAALQKNWDPEPILERARHFSYSSFKERLQRELTA
jgi:phosphatidyl-myo-inositol dimannoside synthase